MAKALYVDDTWYNDINAAGKEAYLACTCYKELLQNFRQEKSTESVFVECLRRVRIGEATENDADFLQKRCCDIKDVASLPPTTLYVASRWETVDAGNQHYLEELEKLEQQLLIAGQFILFLEGQRGKFKKVWNSRNLKSM